MNNNDEFKLQRNLEKRKFYKRFVFKIIEDHYKKKLYSQFHDSCYNCGETEGVDFSKRKPWKLCLDHHIPMIHGGHYELGNFVVLCRKCNSLKHTKSPEDFYDSKKLERLVQILEEQKKIDFAFEFNWEFWMRDRFGYLSSLGIDGKLIEESITNEIHPYYIAPFSERQSCSCVITVDINQLKI
jgi:hypothetical protein